MSKGNEKLIDIEEIRAISTPEKIVITEHAGIRLFEPGISVKDDVNWIANGEVIEQYMKSFDYRFCKSGLTSKS